MNDLNERLEHQKEPSKDTSRRQRSCGQEPRGTNFSFSNCGAVLGVNLAQSGGEMKLMVIWTQFALSAAVMRAVN